jgi:hypothetical protein
VKKCSPRGLVLDTEKVTMKFNKDIVIMNKAINRKEVFANMRDVENIFQFKG